MIISEFINRVGFRVRNEDVDRVNSTISGIKDTATRLLGVLGVGLSLTSMNELTEQYTRVNTQIKNATEALGDQREIQEEIMAAAEATRTSYADTANVVSMLVKGNSEMFADVSEAIKFNNVATMLFKSAGKTNEDIASLMEAINKSFQKGYVDSETISQLLERSPEAVALLNRQLGTTSNKLEELASSGQMTVADLKAAFMDNAEEIEASFENAKYNISSALTVIQSKWGLWLAQTNETIGLTDGIGRMMVAAFNKVIAILNRTRNGVVWLSDKLGGTKNLFRLIAIVAASAFAAFNFSKITAGLLSVSKILSIINIKMLATIAVIVLIALLVEDFINFMRGNDSLIGALFEKAGIDCDAMREKISSAFKSLVSLIGPLIEGLGTILVGFFNGVKSAWSSFGGDIMTVLGTIIGAIAYFISGIAEIVGESDFLRGALHAVGTVLGALIIICTVVAAAFGLASVAAGIFGGAAAALGTVIGFLTSPIGLVILAITALIAIGVLLYRNWEKVKETALAVWQTIRSSISEARDAIAANISSIKNTIISGFQAAISYIQSLPAQAYQWGVDIISNIVNGIKSGVGAVGKAVSGVASKIKSIIGFSEPEDGPLSDFHTYMPDMIDLMSKGIAAGKEKIKDAVGGIASDMSVTAKTDIEAPDITGMMARGIANGKEKLRNLVSSAIDGVSMIANVKSVSPDTAATVRNSSQISKSVVQNVNINNKFEGEKAAQQKAAVAMDKSAKDVTSELARGLAYAR